MDARAKTADILNDEFNYWVNYIENGIGYEKEVASIATYEAERTATLATAKAMLNYLLTPAGKHHRNIEDLHDFTCGIEMRLYQINDAMMRSSLHKQNPNVFNTAAFRAMHERLSFEWAKLANEFTLEKVCSLDALLASGLNPQKNTDAKVASNQEDLKPSKSIFLTIWHSLQSKPQSTIKSDVAVRSSALVS